MDSMRGGEPGSRANAAWGKSEHRHRIGDKENGAKFRNDLERDRLDLVATESVQPPLKGTAQLFSLSTKSAVDRAMAETSKLEVPNPGETGGSAGGPGVALR